MKDEQRYLKSVERFCSRARNDWHRVYLVRRIASLHGMEFAQRLVTEPRFSWVFPAEILQQVHKRHLLLMVLVPSLPSLCVDLGCSCCCVLLGSGQSGSGWEVTCPGPWVNEVSPGAATAHTAVL